VLGGGVPLPRQVEVGTQSGTQAVGTKRWIFTTSGRDGGARSSDGQLDIKLKQPHPAAENLFGAAWSACYMGALDVAASQRNIKLPAGTAVDAEIDLNSDAGSYFLRARLNVSVPGIDPGVARELLGAAHSICPYSKATHGNINVVTTLV
jgi:Ohr subfamily peroxiredoxin